MGSSGSASSPQMCLVKGGNSVFSKTRWRRWMPSAPWRVCKRWLGPITCSLRCREEVAIRPNGLHGGGGASHPPLSVPPIRGRGPHLHPLPPWCRLIPLHWTWSGMGECPPEFGCAAGGCRCSAGQDHGDGPVDGGVMRRQWTATSSSHRWGRSCVTSPRSEHSWWEFTTERHTHCGFFDNMSIESPRLGWFVLRSPSLGNIWKRPSPRN